MLALFLDQNHNVIGRPSVFNFEVAEHERPLEALKRALPPDLAGLLPSPWGQAWHVNNTNLLRGFVFLIGSEWINIATKSQPAWTSLKLTECTGDDILWDLYCDGMLGGYRPAQRRLDVFQFGDSPAMASQLAHLVVKGRKRLTAGWLEATQKQGETIPSSGILSVVTDGFGAPVCLIETVQVDVIPFRDITDEIALEEGEGDLTLADWKEGHRRFFERAATEVNLEFTLDSKIFIERFKLIKVFGG